MQEMDYAEAKQWLESLGQRMEGFDLSNIMRLCELSGMDPAKLKAVHVAGSNGKGSTCAFMERILREAGYRTGLYTSPHLIEPTERIQVSGEKITEKKFVELAGFYRRIIGENAVGSSYFEAMTAMALRHFIEEGIEVLVAEVGMGGRLDATNVLRGEVCIITSISLEHTQYLGNTLEKIAAEKAGIIKENSIVVVSPENPALRTVQKISGGRNAKLMLPEYRINSSDFNGNEIDLMRPAEIMGMRMRMAGKHQCGNAALAAAAACALREKGIEIPESAIRAGAEKAFWPGRLQIVREKPLIVFDAAHNPEGWNALFRSLELFRHERLFVVFGAMEDKDTTNLGKLLMRNSTGIFLTKAHSGRAEYPEILREKLGIGETAGTVGDAIEMVLANAGEKDLVIVTGSLHVLGEAYTHLGIRP